MLYMLVLGMAAALAVGIVILHLYDRLHPDKELTDFQKQLKILQAGGQLFNKVD